MSQDASHTNFKIIGDLIKKAQTETSLDDIDDEDVNVDPSRDNSVEPPRKTKPTNRDSEK